MHFIGNLLLSYTSSICFTIIFTALNNGKSNFIKQYISIFVLSIILGGLSSTYYGVLNVGGASSFPSCLQAYIVAILIAHPIISRSNTLWRVIQVLKIDKLELSFFIIIYGLLLPFTWSITLIFIQLTTIYKCILIIQSACFKGNINIAGHFGGMIIGIVASLLHILKLRLKN